MRKCTYILGILVSLLLVLGLQTSYATTSIPGPFKGIKLEPLTDLTTEGPVRMSLMFFPKGDYGDTLSFQLVGTQGLVSIGPDKQTILANEDGNFVTEFQIRIPDNDTSSLTIQVFPLSPFSEQKCWFVTTEDTVEHWKDHPRTYNGPYRSDPPTGRRGWIIPGEFPDLDSIYGIPPEMIHPLYREQDSTQTRVYVPPPSKAEIDSALLKERRRRLHEMEETPLTEYDRQFVKIGDTIWIRSYGETIFRVAEKITDLEAHSKTVGDSIAAIPPEAMFDVLYFIKHTAQVNALREHIDNLKPTRRKGVFRCRISKALIEMLEEHYGLRPVYSADTPKEFEDIYQPVPGIDSEPSEPDMPEGQ